MPMNTSKPQTPDWSIVIWTLTVAVWSGLMIGIITDEPALGISVAAIIISVVNIVRDW